MLHEGYLHCTSKSYMLSKRYACNCTVYISYLYCLVVSYRLSGKKRPEVDRVRDSYVASYEKLSESDKTAVIAQM